MIGKSVRTLLVLVIFLSCSIIAVRGNFAAVTANQSSPYVEPRTYRMTYNITIANIDARVDSVEIWMPLPVIWDSQENVSLERAYPQVTSKSKDTQNGNGFLYWDLGAIDRGSSRTVMMQIIFTAYDIQYQIDPAKVGAYDKANPDYTQYTKSENYIEAAYPAIAQKAKQLVGNETNPYRQARLIYSWVLQHMTYKLVGEFMGAKFAFDKGYGECGDYSALFAALSRAVGIPTRLVVGLFWDALGVYPMGDDRGIHVWAEFLLPGYGWVPVDASVGDGTRNPYNYFAGHPNSNHFLIMSKGANIHIQLGEDLTMSIFQTGAYWYHGRTGNTEFSYRYSIAAAQIPTTQPLAGPMLQILACVATISCATQNPEPHRSNNE